MTWKDKLTEEELTHIREVSNRRTARLCDAKANYEWQIRYSKEYGAFFCLHCVTIGQKLGFDK